MKRKVTIQMMKTLRTLTNHQKQAKKTIQLSGIKLAKLFNVKNQVYLVVSIFKQINLSNNNFCPSDHLLPTCARDPEQHSKKKQKLSFEINPELLNPNFIKNVKMNWKQNMPLSIKGIEVVVNPFKVCVLQNFLCNKDLMNEIRQEIYELDFNQRNMDLYEFFQSKDLKYLNSNHLSNFYGFLTKVVMHWVSLVFPKSYIF